MQDTKVYSPSAVRVPVQASNVLIQPLQVPKSSNGISNYLLLFIYIVCALLILLPVSYYIYAATTQKSSDCSNFDIMFAGKNTHIQPIDNTYTNALRDYYIKSAYNCCCPGNYKNDFVELCALKDILKQGVRWLDIEVFSVNNKPVIAASTTDNYFEKETYNSIPFQDFLSCINQNAFSDASPNPSDPLFIHIRFKSNNPEMYNALTNIVKDNISSSRLLPDQYNYGYRVLNSNPVYLENLTAVPLNTFLNKIVFVVSTTNDYFLKTPFYEYVNLLSNTRYCQLLTQDEVKFNPDIDELKIQNRQYMTFETPNNNNYNPNCPDSDAARTLGIQCVGMRYNINNTGLLMMNEEFFDRNGYAFVLKPESLRYIPEIVTAVEITKDISIASRPVEFAGGIKGLV